jgi:hypothetical protein
MARGKVQIAWASSPDQLASPLDDWWLRIEERLAEELERVGQQMVAYARGTHPWTNRTGQAEAELHFRLEMGDGFTLTVAHGAPHGVYLEHRWAGRWGVIPQSLTYGYPLAAQAVRNALKG